MRSRNPEYKRTDVGYRIPGRRGNFAPMFGRLMLLAVIVAAVLPAAAAAAPPMITGGPAEGAFVNTRDVTVQFSGAAECAVDDGAFAACADGFTATGLADGNHTIKVRAGGETATRSFWVDATAPTVEFGQPAEGAVVAPTPGTEPIYLASGSINFHASDSSLVSQECRIDAADYGACGQDWYSYRCLANGPHTFQLRLTDKAGNVTVATRHFTLKGWIPNPSCPVPPA